MVVEDQSAWVSRRRSLLAATIAVAVGIVAVFLVAGASSRSHGSHAEASSLRASSLHAYSSHPGPASSPGTQSSGTQSATPVRVLPCTSPNEPTNFTTYSVGPRFEGMTVTNYERKCTKAPRIAPAYVRMNAVWYSYGECVPRATDGSCKLPLVIMTYPLCERQPSMLRPNPHHNPLHGRSTVRGLPADLYQGGHKVLLFTGDSTVSVFATDPARAARAARALVPAPAKPSDPVTPGDSNRPLPAPPEGPVTCD